MLPVIHNIAVFTPQAPLVNTAMPGTTIVHVPYDNVAPSVSSAYIDPNARGNTNTGALPQEAALVQTPVDDGTPAQPAQDFSKIGAPATFLAQLMGQEEVSPQTQVILLQYEKLLTRGNVKYKPSNATKPAPEPAGMFGRILQQERTVEKAPVPVVQAPISTAKETASVAVVRTSSLPAKEIKITDTVSAKSNIVSLPRVVQAYAQAVSRNETSEDTVTDSV